MKTASTEPANQGEAELKPYVSGWGKVFLMLAVALIWNGILSTYVWEIIESFRRGSPDWFLAVTTIPFVLIGIVFVILLADALLALSNPKFKLILSVAEPRLGQDLSLKWESSGTLRRLSNLQFILEGKEVATSSSGQKSITVNSIFCREILFDSSHPIEHGSGNVDFTLPSDLMHTFNTPHNQIEWHIQIEGEIRHWPDVQNEYKLRIKPVAPQ